MSPKAANDARALRVLGRYKIHGRIAAGGMATVHLGRIVGAGGFSRLVAIKRMHESYALDPDFVAMFLDEARLAARIYHPNVVQTLDVIAEDGELLLVMEYVQGESLSRLLSYASKTGKAPTITVSAAIAVHLLHGLHAAHEAKSEVGQPLGIVHRDVSPQNVLVGTDGVPRIIDFGIAKAAGGGRLQTTRDGSIKGKLRYMPPEQLGSRDLDRRADIYSAAVVLWELLCGRRLINVDEDGQAVMRVLAGHHPPPSSVNPSVPAHIDAIVMRALSSNPEERWNTAQEMAFAIEQTGVDTPSTVAEWVASLASDTMARRSVLISAIESDTSVPAADSWARSGDRTVPIKDETGAPPSAVSVVRESGVWKKKRLVQGAVALGVLAVAMTAVGVVVMSAGKSRNEPAAQASSAAAPPAMSLSFAPPQVAAAVPPVASATESPIATASAEVPPAPTHVAVVPTSGGRGHGTSGAKTPSGTAAWTAKPQPTGAPTAPPAAAPTKLDPFGSQ